MPAPYYSWSNGPSSSSSTSTVNGASYPTIDATGDTLYGSAANTVAKLPGNTTTTKKFYTQTGDGTNSAAPGWNTIVAGDVPNLPASQITSGQLALARGGTNADLSATGGTGQVLKQTSVGGNISVAALVASDIQSLAPVWSAQQKVTYAPASGAANGYAFYLSGAAYAQTSTATMQLGAGPFDGSTTGFFSGSANGTMLGLNAASGYTGNMVDMQVAGSSVMKVSNTGGMTVAQLTATSSLIQAPYFLAPVASTALPNTSFVLGARIGIASNTITNTTSSGTVAVGPANRLNQATFAASSATTYTDGATLYIDNAPAAGSNVTITNAWAFYVAAGAAYFGGELRVAARLRQPVTTLTDAATIATDASLGNYFRVTLGGNRTLGNPTNAVDGQKMVFEIIQDGTGGRTLAFDTKFAFGTTISSITVTSTASKRDLIAVVYNSSLDKFLVVGYAAGF